MIPDKASILKPAGHKKEARQAASFAVNGWRVLRAAVILSCCFISWRWFYCDQSDHKWDVGSHLVGMVDALPIKLLATIMPFLWIVRSVTVDKSR